MAKATTQEVFLTSVISALTTISCVEELQDTDVYRQEIKQAGNRFMREMLAYSSKPAGDIYGHSDKTLYAMIDYHKNLATKLARLKPEEFGIIEAIIDKYNEHPAKVLRRLEIKIISSEQYENQDNHG